MKIQLLCEKMNLSVINLDRFYQLFRSLHVSDLVFWMLIRATILRALVSISAFGSYSEVEMSAFFIFLAVWVELAEFSQFVRGDFTSSPQWEWLLPWSSC